MPFWINLEIRERHWDVVTYETNLTHTDFFVFVKSCNVKETMLLRVYSHKLWAEEDQFRCIISSY